VVSATPLAPLLAPATPHQVVHMLLAALMCTGFGVASVYAVAMLRAQRRGKGSGVDARAVYHRRGMAVGLTLGGVVAPLQVVVGDWATRAVADQQPVKLAAIEALRRTGPQAPFSAGPVEVPGLLSLLLHGRTDAVVTGLDVAAPADRPPVAITHVAFQLMVVIGLGLLALAAWAAWRQRRSVRDAFFDSRWFLRATAASGPAAVVALIAGWIVTEVGRQPWIVHLKLRTADAVSTQPGLYWYFYATLAVYALLAASLTAILRRLARAPLADAQPVGVPALTAASEVPR
jgi:cytochrome d ubiquinol oxidase subunit I